MTTTIDVTHARKTLREWRDGTGDWRDHDGRPVDQPSPARGYLTEAELRDLRTYATHAEHPAHVPPMIDFVASVCRRIIRAQKQED